MRIHPKTARAALPVLLGVVLLSIALPADAATGTVSPFISAFSNVVTGWYTTILQVSEEIFYGLFGIDLVYLVTQWLIGGKDVHEIFTSFIKKLMTIGVFYTILLNSQKLLEWVYNGFQQTGVQAGGVGNVSMASIFNALMQVWTALLTGPTDPQSHGLLFDVVHFKSAALSPILGLMLAGITALIVLLIVVYVVIEFFAIKLEALLVGSVGAIMLGFAGSRWTVQHAEGFFKYAISVGVRLLVLTLWLGFVTQQLGTSITTILNIASHNGSSTVGLFEGYGEVLIFFLLIGWLTKKLPSIAGSVLSGSSSLSGGELMGAAVAAGAMAAAAVATGGAAAMAGGKALAGAAGGGGAGGMTASQAVAAYPAAGGGGAAGGMGAGGGMGAAGGAGSMGAEGGDAAGSMGANDVPAPGWDMAGNRIGDAPAPTGGAGSAGRAGSSGEPASRTGAGQGGPDGSTVETSGAAGQGGPDGSPVETGVADTGYRATPVSGGENDVPAPKEKSALGKLWGQKTKIENAVNKTHQHLMPGELEKAKVEAGNIGLKHSE